MQAAEAGVEASWRGGKPSVGVLRAMPDRLRIFDWQGAQPVRADFLVGHVCDCPIVGDLEAALPFTRFPLRCVGKGGWIARRHGERLRADAPSA